MGISESEELLLGAPALVTGVVLSVVLVVIVFRTQGKYRRRPLVWLWVIGVLIAGVFWLLAGWAGTSLVFYAPPVLLVTAVVFIYQIVQNARLSQDVAGGQRQKRAQELLEAIDDALRHAPIPSEQKLLIRKQSADVPQNITKSAEKLRRVWKLQDLARKHTGRSDPELEQMEHSLVATMDDSLDLMFSIPKSLMKVETARDEKAVEKIIAELNETNRRMLDLAEAHADIAKS